MIARLGMPFFILVLLSGCAAAPTGPSFESPVSIARHQAIDGVTTSDPASLQALVEQLDHEDAAVRLHAISTLRDRTGETLGYRYDDPPNRRAQAVERWVRWCGGSDARKAP